MGRFREQIREARQTLHEYMSVDAFYFPWPLPSEPGYAPQSITVRIHDKYVQVGDLKGTNFHYAERFLDAPRGIFLVAEVPLPTRNWIISISQGVAYRVDAAEPNDDLTIAVKLARIRPEDTTEYPYPGMPESSP